MEQCRLISFLCIGFPITANFSFNEPDIKSYSIICQNYKDDKISNNKTNDNLITADYIEKKKNIIAKYSNPGPGEFGEFIKGVKTKLNTEKKVIAFTFDGCGGWGSSGYNEILINFLRKEKIPATLFVTGKWIDANRKTFAQLSADTLFEIENHGLNHRLCSVNGASKYGIAGTNNVGEVVDEMEMNARKIYNLTNRRPHFFRSATAYIDETSVEIARELNLEVVSFSVLSGDAIPDTPAENISQNILINIHPGAIVIMHFNHPNWQEKQALEMAVPKLRKMGYKFVKLENYPLKGN